MFDFLRRMIVPIMAIALVGFLATIVFQWGMDITSRREYLSATTAAVINGEEITWQEFNVVADRLYQAQYADLDEDLADYQRKELRMAAWQRMLHDRLVMQEAARYEITASDQEVYAFLQYSPPPEVQQIEYFQTDGVFDYQKYLSAMADPNAAPFWASIEPTVRNEIIKQKLQSMVIQAAQVTEPELREAYVGGNERVKVGMVNITFGQFSNLPQPSEEELREYYSEHAGDYQVEERAVLNIVMIVKQPEAYDWEVDSAAAMAVYDSVLAGSDFGELAQIYSEDVTAQSGGDLGWFGQGQMVRAFDSAAFSMEAGEVSPPVRTEFGWHIIKVHEFREKAGEAAGAEKAREVHASHILFKVTPSTETADRWHSRLRDFRTSAAEAGFAEAARNFNLELITTKPFSQGGPVDRLGFDPDATQFAFESEVNEISRVLENRTSVLVVQLTEKLPAGLAAYDEVQDRVKRDYESSLIKGLCRDTANVIYAEIQQGTDIKEAAQRHGGKYETPPEFTRNTTIRGLGSAVEPVGAAFALRQPGDISVPVEYSRGSVILQLIERTAADTAQFAAQRDSLYSAVLADKQRELYGLWFDNLVENSDIISNIEDAFAESEQ
ncbi:MAG: peptidylprolyl isomerase [Candidatus Zixiibacteriota bacterium]|nr:MAG: peptidylprolyl isomerase [candidate division Zixibacteria bacterium]